MYQRSNLINYPEIFETFQEAFFQIHHMTGNGVEIYISVNKNLHISKFRKAREYV